METIEVTDCAVEVIEAVETAEETAEETDDSSRFHSPPPDDASDEGKPPLGVKRLSTKGLWSAYAEGVHPQRLARESSRGTATSNSIRGFSIGGDGSLQLSMRSRRGSVRSLSSANLRSSVGSVEDIESDASLDDSLEDDDDWSWDSQDDANHRDYDAWQVLKDEYAGDFGYNFTTFVAGTDDDDLPSSFQILGTGVDDTLAQPHVLSPPNMDALENFLPDTLIGQNFWLKYSLVRDGANMETLKHSVRASAYTILCIETTRGEVFGSFTSSVWTEQRSFFGNLPSFVWRMRCNRRSKCSSLFDQAHMESELDVYMADVSEEQGVQICRDSLLGVGGDEDRMSDAFAICIDSDLIRGTTSPSAIFHSPKLCPASPFEIGNIEVWTLTPCSDVQAAERLEVTKYNSSHGNSAERAGFYTRVGNDLTGQERRDRWENTNGTYR